MESVNTHSKNEIEIIENSSPGGPRPPHDLKFDHFTSLSRRERQRNASKCKTYVPCVHNYCDRDRVTA